MSAIAQTITTVAKRSRLLDSVMNTHATMFLPKIWKKEPAMLPLDLPARMSRI